MDIGLVDGADKIYRIRKLGRKIFDEGQLLFRRDAHHHFVVSVGVSAVRIQNRGG